MIKIKFYTTLRLYLNVKEIEIKHDDSETIESILKKAEKKVNKEFLFKLFTDDGLKKGTMILLNGKNIIHLQGRKTPVKENDEIAVFPPGGGG